MTLIDFDAARALRDSGSPFLYCPTPDLVEVMLEDAIRAEREPIRLLSSRDHALRLIDCGPGGAAGMVALDGEAMVADKILRASGLPDVFEVEGPVPVSKYAVALLWLSDLLGLRELQDDRRLCRPSDHRSLGKLLALDVALFHRDVPAEGRVPLSETFGLMEDDLRNRFPEDYALRSLTAILDYLVEVGLTEWPADVQRSCLPRS